MGKTVILFVLGAIVLIVVGKVVISLLGTIISIIFYLLVGAAVVGGALYLIARARRSLRGNGPRAIR